MTVVRFNDVTNQPAVIAFCPAVIVRCMRETPIAALRAIIEAARCIACCAYISEHKISPLVILFFAALPKRKSCLLLVAGR